MKTKILLLLSILVVVTGRAQTNAIVFPELMSCTNTVLMTNAEFRCYSGRRIFFADATGTRGFTAAQLDARVLTRLGTSAEACEQRQAEFEAVYAKSHQSIIDQAKEKARLREAAIKQSIIAQSNAVKYAEEHPPEFHYYERPVISDRQRSGIGAP